MATATQNKPVFSTRHGRLDAAVWENQGEKSTFFNVSLKKSYKNEESEEWKSTQASFGHDDALGAASLLGWADDVVQKAVQQQEPFHGDKKPLASRKRGMLEVAVWQKETDKLRYRVSLKRSYKDGDDWKSVVIWLLANDCLAAARVLTRAFDAIDSHVAASNSSIVESAKDTFDAEVVSSDEDIPF
jgi:hypothetical protein